MHRGYVKIWRKVIDSGLMQEPVLWTFFSYCLIKATHKPRKYAMNKCIVDTEPGQFVFGRKSASAELNMSEQTIRTCLKKLEKLEIITSKPTNKYTVITVNNWAFYQNNEENQPANQPATNQQLTSNQPATNQQLTTDKNVRIKTQENESTEKSFEPKGSCPESEKSAPKKPKTSKPDEIPENLQTPEFLGVWEEWKQHRREKKQTLTDTTKKKQLKSFSEVGPDVAIMAISDAIEKGYTGVFVKNFTGQNSTKTNKKPETPKGEPIKTEPLYNPFTDPNFGKGTVIPKNTIELKDGEYERL